LTIQKKGKEKEKPVSSANGEDETTSKSVFLTKRGFLQFSSKRKKAGYVKKEIARSRKGTTGVV